MSGGSEREPNAVKDGHRITVTVCIPLRRWRRASNKIKIVGEEFRLAQGRGVVAPKVIVLEFGKGERVLFSDPVVNTRVS